MNRQSGLALVAAIFIMVIVGLLGQVLITITNTQRQTSLLSLQSARAYQAANAGIEWGLAKLINEAQCPASSTLTLPAQFTISVSCQQHGTYIEKNDAITIYHITATSQLGQFGSIDYVSRTIDIEVQI